MKTNSIDKVIERIESIESKIHSLSFNFAKTEEIVHPFKQTLNIERSRLPHNAKLRLDAEAFGGARVSDEMELFYKEIKEKIKDQRVTTDSLSAIIKSHAKDEIRQKDWLLKTAEKDPHKIVEYEDFKMQAYAAMKFRELQKMIKKEFPDRNIYITSTMGGKHLSSAHPEGRAIDFVVDGLTVAESKIVEKMAVDCGFWAYNEYIHDSPYKTGPHMHIEL